MHNLQCESTRLAEACIPFQEFEELFSPKESLRNGTVFPSLFRPYTPKQ